MAGVFAAPPAELRKLELLGVRTLVLGRGVVSLPTVGAFQGDDDACSCHDLLRDLVDDDHGTHFAFAGSLTSSRILVTTPAPTVLPPSRIAKRRPSSQAIGVRSSMSRLMLSPGMTISTPSGN